MFEVLTVCYWDNLIAAMQINNLKGGSLNAEKTVTLYESYK